MDLEFGDVVRAQGVRHLVLGKATFRFSVEDLLVTHGECDDEMDVAAGMVVLMSLENRPRYPLGFIDAHLESTIEKED